MRIDVTQRDIDLGCQMDASNCPVARAVARATGMIASVTYESIMTFASEADSRSEHWDDLALRMWETPEEVRRWIGNFDTTARLRPVEPFSFEL